MRAVAIITRTKNRPVLLKRALKSVLTQTFKDFVWVIINDGGDTVPIEAAASEAMSKGLDVLVVNNPSSLGMEAASNAGIRNSETEFVVIHDDDDTWEPQFLEKTVGFLKSKHGGLYGGVATHSTRVEERIDGDECKILTRSPFNDWLNTVYITDMARTNLFTTNSFLYRRFYFDKINGYDKTLPVLGDWDFNLRFLLNADIAVIREPLANYHHRINQTGDYCNTIVPGVSYHQEYDTILRNRLLRKDLDAARIGIGFLVNYGKEFDRVVNTVSLGLLNVNNLSRILEGTAFGRFIRRFYRFFI